MYYRGYVRPQDYQNEILRLKSRCRKLEDMLFECIEWLESRPDYAEGDLATSSKARDVMEELKIPSGGRVCFVVRK